MPTLISYIVNTKDNQGDKQVNNNRNQNMSKIHFFDMKIFGAKVNEEVVDAKKSSPFLPFLPFY